ncbi:alpha/beta hydrolase [Oscillospiraceae bacterium]|nr:alpha/beta hydrolase [Oscillospiraceae bacterium]BDF74810.1 alpha/beta hydrolase [Oscillospiraceae bacterium]
MNVLKRILRVALLFCLSNLLFWIRRPELPLWLRIVLAVGLAVWYVVFQIRPRREKAVPKRLQIMIGGYELFLTAGWCAAAECLFYLALALYGSPDVPVWLPLLVNLAVFLPLVFLTVLNGFLRLVFTSVQLGILWRVLLLLCWWVPVLNIALFWKACRVVHSEYRFETAKLELDSLRKENEVCRTRYPIVLIHGIFFRDWQLVNYWGRIPRELVRNGAELHYGRQQSAAPVAQSAAELKGQILKVLEETGAEKVNLIAHSKGGLDSRCAISTLGLAPHVASLTTINTPHRGCIFAEVLLGKLPAGIVAFIAKRYNALFRKLGDRDPDFLGGVRDLAAGQCAAFNKATPDAPGVLYQSVMSTMGSPSGAAFPLSFTYRLVRKYDKEENDGLVSLSSSRWGVSLGNLTTPGKRGISHGDVIDLMRENIEGFDVREFYVNLVKDLKAKGL